MNTLEKVGIWILIILATGFATTSIVFLILYTDTEIANNLHNTAAPTIISNSASIIALVFTIRMLVHWYAQSLPNAKPPRDKDFVWCMWTFAGFAEIACLTSGYIAYGWNCTYGHLPCYTITSPLYIVVLIHTQLVFLAGGITALVFLGFLLYGMFICCECEELCCCFTSTNSNNNNNNNPIVPAHQETDKLNITVDNGDYMTFKNVDDLNKRQKDSQCGICHIDYIPDAQVKVLKTCSHYFHKECIDVWFQQKSNNVCPVCQAK